MAAKEIRILHIDTGKTWRGGQQQAFYLHRSLVTKGIYSNLVCLPDSEIQKRCKENNLNFCSVNIRGEVDLISVLKISKICKNENINIIQAHSAHALSIGLLTKLLNRKIKLIGVRRVDFKIKKNILSKIKYNSKLVDKIVTVSDAIKEILKKDEINDEKLLTIYDGIDLERFKKISIQNDLRNKYNIPEDNIIVGTIAAFVGHKDYPNLINAAKNAIEKNNTVTFLSLGEGSLKIEMENLVAKLNISDNFIFAGFQKDVISFLAVFDIFVLSSKMEGLGSTILDALAMGVPVIATNTGGIPEMIVNNKNGILVEPQNPIKLSQAILELIADTEKRNMICAEGKKSVEKFSIENIVEKNIELYKNLLVKNAY